MINEIERLCVLRGWVNISTPDSLLFYNTSLFARDAGTVVWECLL